VARYAENTKNVSARRTLALCFLGQGYDSEALPPVSFSEAKEIQGITVAPVPH